MKQGTIIYVDVDETLVRNYGKSRIPIPAVINKVRQWHSEGAELYCWSSGGAAYARTSAQEVGLEDCFSGFLPKPQIVVDDQPIADWRRLEHIHPSGVDNT